MILKVIGSDSSGNGYALIADSGEILLIEAGMEYRRMLKAIEYQTNNVVGCLVSHRHNDHAAYVNKYIERAIPIYSNKDVVYDKLIYNFTIAHQLEEYKSEQIGEFKVCAFSLYHDVPTYGYNIKHPEVGNILFATDTFDLPKVFKNVNHWLIEANYSDEIVDHKVRGGQMGMHERERLMVSHMSLENTIARLHESYENPKELEKLKSITLIHLSSRNSDSKDFKLRMIREFGVPTHIAKAGREFLL